MTRGKKAAILTATVLLLGVILFCVCSCCSSTREPAQREPEVQTLVDTDTMRITAQGLKTTVSDLAGGSEYGFTTRFVRKGQGSGSRTTADTPTVKITINGADLIVTDRTAGITYTVHRGRTRAK